MSDSSWLMPNPAPALSTADLEAAYMRGMNPQLSKFAKAGLSSHEAGLREVADAAVVQYVKHAHGQSVLVVTQERYDELRAQAERS